MFEFTPVTIERKTRESLIQTTVKGGPFDPNLKANINTSLHFLSHMIEQWAWRSCLNLSTRVELDAFVLQHVIAEDCGQCFGEAMARVVMKMMEDQGINGSGVGDGYIDEAASRVKISYEFRTGFFVNKGAVTMPEHVEDMLCADLWNFLSGFAVGSRATLHIDLLSGDDPHHIWESVFRAFGEATRNVLSPCPWRKGLTPGVAGFVEVTSK
jgi:imidazoleglycerol-phosphate dehydratase